MDLEKPIPAKNDTSWQGTVILCTLIVCATVITVAALLH